jgi:ankyrin repeat protein
MKHLLLTTIAAVVLVGCGPRIHKAAEEGNIEVVKKHLADGADVNAKSEFGTTPLHSTLREGDKEITKLLITNGADVNAKDSIVGTPLDYDNMYNRTETNEIADLLRKHGGKIGEELKAD